MRSSAAIRSCRTRNTGARRRGRHRSTRRSRSRTSSRSTESRLAGPTAWRHAYACGNINKATCSTLCHRTVVHTCLHLRRGRYASGGCGRGSTKIDRMCRYFGSFGRGYEFTKSAPSGCSDGLMMLNNQTQAPRRSTGRSKDITPTALGFEHPGRYYDPVTVASLDPKEVQIVYQALLPLVPLLVSFHFPS